MHSRDVFTEEEWAALDADWAAIQVENQAIKCLKTRPRLGYQAVRTLYGADVPRGFHLHHICGNRWCGNPEHLVAVSPEDHRKLHRKESFCA